MFLDWFPTQIEKIKILDWMYHGRSLQVQGLVLSCSLQGLLKTMWYELSKIKSDRGGDEDVRNTKNIFKKLMARSAVAFTQMNI